MNFKNARNLFTLTFLLIAADSLDDCAPPEDAASVENLPKTALKV